MKCTMSAMNKSVYSEKDRENFGVQQATLDIIDHFGFRLQFLIDQAHTFADAGNWGVYNRILALCLYGIVLFPNIVEFVDMNSIRMFLLGNPIPTLLGDLKV